MLLYTNIKSILALCFVNHLPVAVIAVARSFMCSLFCPFTSFLVSIIYQEHLDRGPLDLAQTFNWNQ